VAAVQLLECAQVAIAVAQHQLFVGKYSRHVRLL
jgi:hypothetical protein